MMVRLLSVTGLIVVAALAVAAPAQARNYDCTKPGNANKAVCKNAAQATPAPAPAAAMAAPPAPAATSAPAAAGAGAKRNYDCSKAGNANKAVCKNATAATAPVASARPLPAPAFPAARATAPAAVATAAPAAAVTPAAAAGHVAGPAVISPTGARIVPWTTKTGKLVHYDCSKAGNLTKQACKQ